ncbi:MAG: hypothetical protein F6K40_01525 [Okeania sp. SIO3I5]|uniref:hypothetical protein n=1 Tax=Okeania sp. SIO3I5 TaxID=2607805 RepID=UPI0013BD2C79|nr:hypothetical protein [Okeania sp. SIO3I5]NEQ35058.1 hypothetical protein [Okeania sp. SIO3I5]
MILSGNFTTLAYSAFQIDEPHRHKHNPVGRFHGTSLLWSTVQENCCMVNKWQVDFLEMSI